MISNTLLTVLMIGIASLLFSLIGGAKVLSKAGESGWKLFHPKNLYKIVDAEDIYKMESTISSVSAVFVVGFDGARFITGIWITLAILYLILLWLHSSFCQLLAAFFGKGKTFAYGLTFLYPVYIMILGFGSAAYKGRLFYQSGSGPWVCPKYGAENLARRGTCTRCGTVK